jgi:hypothetical protein
VITLSYCFYSLWDIFTTNPGFLDHGNLTREEFWKQENKITIKNKIIELKFCDTCQIVRPVRSFHCDTCGNCVKMHGKNIN